MKTSNRLGVRFLVAALLLFVGACDEGQRAELSVADFSAEREAKKAELVSAKASVESAPATEVEVAAYRYDATGKRDPFRSFLWERPEIVAEVPAEGPLEKFDVGQLSLLAVVWKTGSARALVQDPSGGNFIVAEGARVGKNSGRVTRIEDGLVVVRETYVDYLGQETRKDIEMRMRRNEGG